jgi:hypothetical protein
LAHAEFLIDLNKRLYFIFQGHAYFSEELYSDDMDSMVWELNAVTGNILTNCPAKLCTHPDSYTMCTVPLLRVNLPARGIKHLPRRPPMLKSSTAVLVPSLGLRAFLYRHFIFYTACKTVSWVPKERSDVKTWWLKMTSTSVPLMEYVVRFNP